MSSRALGRDAGRSGESLVRPAAPARLDPRTRQLVEAPIARTLLRLAAPNVLVMVVQASVGLVETYFVGRLGTDALAGVALVFPVLMLMQMMSAGAVGGGISSAIARALGAGRRDDADALAIHALAVDVARRRADLFRRDFLGCDPAVDLQFARKRDPRRRQHGGAGCRDLSRCGGAGPALALSHLRLGAIPATRHRRRGRGGGRFL